MTKDMGRQFNKILNQSGAFEKTKGSYRLSYLDDFFRYRTRSDLYKKELSMLDELERALFFLTNNDTCELLKAKGCHWWKYFDDNRQKLTDYIPRISLYDKTFEDYDSITTFYMRLTAFEYNFFENKTLNRMGLKKLRQGTFYGRLNDPTTFVQPGGPDKVNTIEAIGGLRRYMMFLARLHMWNDARHWTLLDLIYEQTKMFGIFAMPENRRKQVNGKNVTYPIVNKHGAKFVFNPLFGEHRSQTKTSDAKRHILNYDEDPYIIVCHVPDNPATMLERKANLCYKFARRRKHGRLKNNLKVYPRLVIDLGPAANEYMSELFIIDYRGRSSNTVGDSLLLTREGGRHLSSDEVRGVVDEWIMFYDKYNLNNREDWNKTRIDMTDKIPPNFVEEDGRIQLKISRKNPYHPINLPRYLRYYHNEKYQIAVTHRQSMSALWSAFNMVSVEKKYKDMRLRSYELDRGVHLYVGPSPFQRIYLKNLIWENLENVKVAGLSTVPIKFKQRGLTR
jgi:hypothetical protein